MAKGIHLFPYRTQKLSLSAPMVLGWRRPGRVGRCRIPKRRRSRQSLGFLLFGCFCKDLRLLVIPANVQHCTWLGEPWAAPGGRKESPWRTPGRVGRCRIPQEKGLSICWVLFLVQRTGKARPIRIISNHVQHCTWLGGAVKNNAQICLQVWQNKVCTAGICP